MLLDSGLTPRKGAPARVFQDGSHQVSLGLPFLCWYTRSSPGCLPVVV